MRVNKRFRDAKLGGDIVQRGACETPFVEEFDRFFEDPLPLVGQNFFAHRPMIALYGLD